MKPKSVTIRSYDVGFGDCYLLSFAYAATTRHVLIDFGSHPGAKRKTAGTKVDVAKHIAKSCNNDLTAVVATHRHADHINGFATNAKGTGPGDIIRACAPKVVIQPWTERPELGAQSAGPKSIVSASVQHAAAMRGVVDFFQGVQRQLRTAPAAWRTAVRELRAKSELGTHTLNAVTSLEKMAPKAAHKYVHFGKPAGLAKLLPGVRVRVLGPPTIAQAASIEAQVEEHDEFWKVMGATARTFAAASGGLSSRYATNGPPPTYARWLVERADQLAKSQLLNLVRRMDDYLNNTSVILLLEVGKKKLLFPGDAQIENWSYALSKPSIAKLLAGVDVYKVGHHGSRNATPRHVLWEKFTKRKKASGKLITLMSTEPGHHGTTAVTRVPSGKLTDALKAESEYYSTHDTKLTKQDGIAFLEKKVDV